MNTYHGEHNKKIIFVDKSMVVPYNPCLLMKYDCHINVEYCRSIMGIKYIYNNDEAKNAKISNEIRDYIDCRYLSASESAWRIFELPLHGRSHSVGRLPVHLPGVNRVLFEEGKESEAIAKNGDTKLTAFFQLNKIAKEARQIKYEDIPLQYKW
ncbi:uncharacterized protein B4U80_11195 [Leptotrombidium deliense]|uniref:Uncharacterized protein n=1 Tax=Leptotrombidium deliense TaxID=299467 RepID=A0A443RUW8_9ACAR|nr:uncharacterized protein B4U80_11195 [Leptotrombidium deliense]